MGYNNSLVCNFRVQNASTTSQFIIHITVFSVRWQFAHIYLDDVVNFSRKKCQHIDYNQLFLSLLKEAGVPLSLKSWAISTDELDYLGHDIRRGRLEVDSHTTDVIGDANTPTTQNEIRLFIDFRNVIGRLFENCVCIEALLTARI